MIYIKERILSFVQERWGEIVSGLIVAVIPGAIIYSWENVMALMFPGPLSGVYTMIMPDDKPGEYDIARTDLKSHGERVWGNKKDLKTDKTWDYEGFFKSKHLVIAYKTAGLLRIGIGTYFLEYTELDGKGQFAGQWQGISCKKELLHSVVERCPALLIAGDVTKREDLKLTPNQAALLAGKCEIVEFVKAAENVVTGPKCPANNAAN